MECRIRRTLEYHGRSGEESVDFRRGDTAIRTVLKNRLKVDRSKVESELVIQTEYRSIPVFRKSYEVKSAFTTAMWVTVR